MNSLATSLSRVNPGQLPHVIVDLMSNYNAVPSVQGVHPKTQKTFLNAEMCPESAAKNFLYNPGHPGHPGQKKENKGLGAARWPGCPGLGEIQGGNPGHLNTGHMVQRVNFGSFDECHTTGSGGTNADELLQTKATRFTKCQARTVVASCCCDANEIFATEPASLEFEATSRCCDAHQVINPKSTKRHCVISKHCFRSAYRKLRLGPSSLLPQAPGRPPPPGGGGSWVLPATLLTHGHWTA